MKVLLHCCCGPCSIVCIEMLREAGHDITGYFANPNIHPLSEYLRRREAMEQVAERMGIPMLWQDDVYNMSGWIEAVHSMGIAQNPEARRCAYCYSTRLSLTAAVAVRGGFDAFTTSLLYSIYQKHELICEEARRAEAMVNHSSQFLYTDFRVGWQRGNDLAKEFGIFRQNYCACIFSEEERFSKKIKRLSEKAAYPADELFMC